jgi:hypothetical protein
MAGKTADPLPQLVILVTTAARATGLKNASEGEREGEGDDGKTKKCIFPLPPALLAPKKGSL